MYIYSLVNVEVAYFPLLYTLEKEKRKYSTFLPAVFIRCENVFIR